MLRSGEQVPRAGKLDDAAEVHDRDPMTDMLHHRQIMGDEEIGQAQFALQVHHQVDHLRLHGDIERRHRFVGNDQPRFERQRPGDAEPLALAA